MNTEAREVEAERAIGYCWTCGESRSTGQCDVIATPMGDWKVCGVCLRIVDTEDEQLLRAATATPEGGTIMLVVRLLVAVLYFLGFFLGLPLLLVGTGMLMTNWLGTAWWAGLLIAPVILAEFIGGLAFVEWENNPIPTFILPD